MTLASQILIVNISLLFRNPAARNCGIFDLSVKKHRTFLCGADCLYKTCA